MLSFEKLRCAFDENFVRCAHYRVCNANSPAAVELFVRNGTQTEPCLCIKILISKSDIWAKYSVFKNRTRLLRAKEVSSSVRSRQGLSGEGRTFSRPGLKTSFVLKKETPQTGKSWENSEFRKNSKFRLY